jgi:hypothetical protein
VIHTTVLTSARAADVITAMSMWAGREFLLHITQDTTRVTGTFGVSYEILPSLVA